MLCYHCVVMGFAELCAVMRSYGVKRLYYWALRSYGAISVTEF